MLAGEVVEHHLAGEEREQGAVGAVQQVGAAAGGHRLGTGRVGAAGELPGRRVEADLDAELARQPVGGDLELQRPDTG